jgi:hypothetical protein
MYLSTYKYTFVLTQLYVYAYIHNFGRFGHGIKKVLTLIEMSLWTWINKLDN